MASCEPLGTDVLGREGGFSMGKVVAQRSLNGCSASPKLHNAQRLLGFRLLFPNLQHGYIVQRSRNLIVAATYVLQVSGARLQKLGVVNFQKRAFAA